MLGFEQAEFAPGCCGRREDRGAERVNEVIPGYRNWRRASGRLERVFRVFLGK